MTDTSLVSYYAARAAEYERVYDKPERQADLRQLHAMVPALLEGRRVLEVACGTGYWTRRIAPVAASMVALDLAPETIVVAQANQSSPNVSFQLGDAFALATVAGEFDAAFAGFWWSHVRHDEMNGFLEGLHNRLESGSRIVFIDNRFVEGSNWPITRIDSDGNTYQRRWLENGVEHEVLKNFPTTMELRGPIERAGGVELSIVELRHYWVAAYRIGL
ncbi:MAG: class I SAM-dependent methyltransferase [bacterium]